MANTVKDVMTKNAVMVQANTPIAESARLMQEKDIGSVIVMEGEKVCGIVTDRDIVVRGVAPGKDVKKTAVDEICSRILTTVTPETSLDDAIQMMRDKAVRRLPVVTDGTPIGVVSLGDLAQERDPHSVLGKVSGAAPNR